MSRGIGARSLALAVLVAGAVSLGPSGRVGAASFVLADGDRAAAREAGRDSVNRDAFGGEWRVENAAGERVTVLTPFHRLALAARQAAFREEPLRAADETRLVRDTRERVTFLTEVRGDRPAFAVHYRARLVVGSREVQPVFAQNERTAAPRTGGGFAANCVYVFATRDVPGTAVVTLVVQDADGRPVSRFTIDLSKMR